MLTLAIQPADGTSWTFFQIVTMLIVLSAVCGYINIKFIKLPSTIGIMIVALVMSVLLITVDRLGIKVEHHADALLNSIDFNKALMHGMLGFLLFAGALHMNLNDLAGQKWVIASLATLGIIVSTIFVGAATWVVTRLCGVDLPFGWCLLFGSLISPTDPIAVMGIVRKLGVPKSLETKIAGESLFNDGVGVAVFIVLWHVVIDGHGVSAGGIATVFAKEALGGAVFGLSAGLLVYQLLRRVDNYQLEIMLTLALVMGVYALAGYWHLSGPIAVVVAGLLIGNHGRNFAMSQKTREHLDMFWELIDEILNAVLFLLIGLEVLVLPFTYRAELVALIMIPLVLAARWVSVTGTVLALRFGREFTRGVCPILTWGGLRGGISVALALSLPAEPNRQTVLVMTYAIVVFSIIVQGLTIGPLVRRFQARA